MEHFYQKVPGFFTFPDFYKWLAQETITGSAWNPPHDKLGKIVEVGVWTGQSVAFLGVEILNLNSETTIDLVDLSLAAAKENLRTLESTGVLGAWHEMPSVDAARLYEPGSLNAVFIDANHTFEGVMADINAWLPKIRKGGLICGHDFCNWAPQNFGVIRAVTESFDKFSVWRGSKGMGSEEMKPHYWPVWSHRVT